MKIIPSSRRYGHVAKAGMCLIALLLIAGMSGCYDEYPQLPPCGSQNLEIWTWYDLDAVRDNRCGNHTLMNDLDSTTPGYEELAGPTASGGKGWDPVAINGTFNGQGYEIRGLFINRPDEGSVGLFSWACRTAVIKNVGVVNATVTGEIIVGGLLGKNDGTLNNCYALGNISGGGWGVGGLVGFNDESFDYSGVVCECYSAGMVSGHMFIGGLVGENSGTVSASYASGNTTGSAGVGGLVGWNYGTVSASYASGNTTGSHGVAGLVGWNGQGIVSDSYSIGSVSGNSSVGGLVGEMMVM